MSQNEWAEFMAPQHEQIGASPQKKKNGKIMGGREPTGSPLGVRQQHNYRPAACFKSKQTTRTRTIGRGGRKLCSDSTISIVIFVLYPF